LLRDSSAALATAKAAEVAAEMRKGAEAVAKGAEAVAKGAEAVVIRAEAVGTRVGMDLLKTAEKASEQLSATRSAALAWSWRGL